VEGGLFCPEQLRVRIASLPVDDQKIGTFAGFEAPDNLFPL
jgi:hypothetical protein